jgi:hypothetical protein
VNVYMGVLHLSYGECVRVVAVCLQRVSSGRERCVLGASFAGGEGANFSLFRRDIQKGTYALREMTCARVCCAPRARASSLTPTRIFRAPLCAPVRQSARASGIFDPPAFCVGAGPLGGARAARGDVGARARRRMRLSQSLVLTLLHVAPHLPSAVYHFKPLK